MHHIFRDMERILIQRRSTPREACYRQVKTAPKEVYRAGFPSKWPAKGFHHPVHMEQNLPETMGIFRIIRRMFFILFKRNLLLHFHRNCPDLNTNPQRMQYCHKFAVKGSNRFSLQRDRAHFAVAALHLVSYDKILALSNHEQKKLKVILTKHNVTFPFVIAFLAALFFEAAPPTSKPLLNHFMTFQLAGLLFLGAAGGVFVLLLREGKFLIPWQMNRQNAFRLVGAILFRGVFGPLALLWGL